MIRTPDQRLRVFVSSALRELETERAAARAAISRLRLIPVLFESGARPYPARELYRAYIEQSQIFIGIYWQSYGWVAPGTEVSGLEDEFRLAGDRPRLIYVKRPAPERDPRLDALLGEIKRDAPVTYRYFSTADELQELIENDLAMLLTERFAGGPVGAESGATASAGGPPGGTLTLLFTDIEESTRLLQFLGEEYERVLAEHQQLIRAAVRQHGGHEVDTTGDGFFIVFPRAREAVLSAIDAQRAIYAHSWPGGSPLRVRMGLHTGEPARSQGKYVGLDVHRAARIASAAWGGQILLSHTTRDLVEGDLPEGTTLRDLGMHRLKDLQRSEHLHQVVRGDLPAEFPPLPSLDTLPNNLPRKLTSFIGREQEIADVRRLLATTPLLTIVGVGGAGKTRLALQVGADLLAGFRHGAWLVEFAPVSDPRQVPEAVAVALGVREYPGLSLHASLLHYLSTRHLLLVLDNCEHVIAAAAELVETLLSAAPDVRLLCTSREPLGIAGETIWRIPSLRLPRAGPDGSVASLAQNEAVRLFAERARTVAPGFELTGENTPLIARICVRLDGIPLAIELAAARVRVLSVQQVAARLDDRFRLLAGGSRTALPRQQTLRAAMDWSHDLLTAAEQTLLRRLSVFAGGWTLEAAEVICGGRAEERAGVLDLLTRLVDKSLVEVDGAATPRYTMLETVRQYAREKLLDAQEAPQFRSRHRDWFLALAEEAAAHLQGPQQRTWLDRLEREWDNLQVALEWSTEGQDPAPGLRMAGALWRFWYLRGHLTTGATWLEEALRRAPAPTITRAWALNGAAVLAHSVGSYTRAVELADETMRLARTLGDDRALASGQLLRSAVHQAQGDFGRAASLADESLAVFRTAEDLWGQALALSVLGDLAVTQGEYESALRRYEESTVLFRRVGDAWGIAYSQRGSGFAARLQGDYDLAASLQAASLAAARELGDRLGIGYALIQMGFVQWRQGEYAQASALLQESLSILRESGNRRGVADVLSVLGLVEEYQGHHERAEQVLQESVDLYRTIGSRIGVASVLGTLGRVALHAGDDAHAAALAQESVALFREMGDRRGTATSLRLLGEAVLHRGDHAGAARHAEESLGLFRALGDRWAIGYALRLVAAVAAARGEHDKAFRHYVESLRLHREHGDRLGIVKCLEGLAGVLAAAGRFERGARLFGAAEGLREAIGAPLTHVEIPTRERSITRFRDGLGEARYDALRQEGRSLGAEEIDALVGAALEAGS
jgi:predicted ATPase/class 3 adenylate cyclase